MPPRRPSGPMGGFGYAKEYYVEGKWPETRLTQIAPILTSRP
jgi:hypothetical protein